MKTTAILLRSSRAFPLSVWVTFKRGIQIFTHKFTPLSILMQKCSLESLHDDQQA